MQKFIWNLPYLLGKAPWDTGITPPEVVEVVEGGSMGPGRALDIGCGTGTNSLYLARKGFQVVGVDVAWLAVRKARRSARRRGLAVEFHVGEVLALGTADGPSVQGPFDMALDVGCFHALGGPGRTAYGGMLRRVMRPGGRFLLYAWAPGKDGEATDGVSPQATRAALGDAFQLVWLREGQERGRPSCWYLFDRID